MRQWASPLQCHLAALGHRFAAGKQAFWQTTKVKITDFGLSRALAARPRLRHHALWQCCVHPVLNKNSLCFVHLLLCCSLCFRASCGFPRQSFADYAVQCCPAGFLDPTTVALSTVGTQPYCAPEVLGSLAKLYNASCMVSGFGLWCNAIRPSDDFLVIFSICGCCPHHLLSPLTTPFSFLFLGLVLIMI